MKSFPLVLALSSYLASVIRAKDGWTCESDGFYYENGVKSSYACSKDSGDNDKTADGEKSKDSEVGNKDKGQGCTVTSMSSSVMTALERTCIDHPPNGAGRCWWTHVPSQVASATDGRKVPLIIDMHGGGGCASDQFQSSGLKDLADSSAASGGGMIVVYPQGGEGGLWASAGTSSRKTGSGGKGLPQWDDIGFLEQLIANMVGSSTHKAKIDAERVYLSGFSLGCMMAQRFALERSKIVAAVGCHGGELSFYPTNQNDMDSDKSNYNLELMPAYLTIGENDEWMPGANASWHAWKYWNGCTAAEESYSASDLLEHVASSCAAYTPALQTVMLEIKGLPHVPDARAYEKAYQFMSQFKRTNALANVPSAVETIVPPDASTSKTRRGESSGVASLIFLTLSLGISPTLQAML